MKEKITYNRAKTWQIALFTLNNTATNMALFLMGYYAYFSQNASGVMALIIDSEKSFVLLVIIYCA